MSSQAQKILLKAVADGTIGTAALSMLHKDQCTRHFVGAYPNTQGELQVPNRQTLFDLASVTKSVPNALLALIAIDQGIWELDLPLQSILPAWQGGFADQVKLRHLLTHTLDFRVSMSTWKDLSPEEFKTRLLTFPCEIPPGESYLYCNATSILLGWALEAQFNKSLATLAQEWIFGPLDMQNTGFRAHEWAQLDTIVPTEFCPWRRQAIRGFVHDESAFALQPEDLGSAGLFSCLEDLEKVASSLILSGQSETTLLSPKMRIQLQENATPQLNTQTSLGFERNNPRWMSGAFPMALGKTGFTGSTFFLDPVLQKSFILLCNWTWPQRKPQVDRIFALRKELSQALFEL